MDYLVGVLNYLHYMLRLAPYRTLAGSIGSTANYPTHNSSIGRKVHSAKEDTQFSGNDPDMFVPFIADAGTANLLAHLKRAQQHIEDFNNSSPDAGGLDLAEQIKDLIAVVQLIDEVAAKERLGASTQLKALSATDLMLSQSACTSNAIVN